MHEHEQGMRINYILSEKNLLLLWDPPLIGDMSPKNFFYALPLDLHSVLLI